MYRVPICTCCAHYLCKSVWCGVTGASTGTESKKAITLHWCVCLSIRPGVCFPKALLSKVYFSFDVNACLAYVCSQRHSLLKVITFDFVRKQRRLVRTRMFHPCCSVSLLLFFNCKTTGLGSIKKKKKKLVSAKNPQGAYVSWAYIVQLEGVLLHSFGFVLRSWDSVPAISVDSSVLWQEGHNVLLPPSGNGGYYNSNQDIHYLTFSYVLNKE